jgi:uncharacterized protein
VKPGCSKTGLSQSTDCLIVRLKSPPVDGRANIELLEAISDLAGVPKTSIKLISGLSSRSKTVFVPLLPDELTKRIDEKISID